MSIWLDKIPFLVSYLHLNEFAVKHRPELVDRRTPPLHSLSPVLLCQSVVSMGPCVSGCVVRSSATRCWTGSGDGARFASCRTQQQQRREKRRRGSNQATTEPTRTMRLFLPWSATASMRCKLTRLLSIGFCAAARASSPQLKPRSLQDCASRPFVFLSFRLGLSDVTVGRRSHWLHRRRRDGFGDREGNRSATTGGASQQRSQTHERRRLLPCKSSSTVDGSLPLLSSLLSQPTPS